jgi:hypothetical protein
MKIMLIVNHREDLVMSLQRTNLQRDEVLEKVMLSSDLSGLSPLEKVMHIKRVCESLGLNPLTSPIKLIKFQGKEIAYCSKDATEQLRKNNKVSITSIVPNLLEGGLYVVTATASIPDGRQDSSTGAVVTKGLNGDALANAMMKAETKAKRRVTLSICGLGFMDESEVESLPLAQNTKTYQVATPVSVLPQKQEMDDPKLMFSNLLKEIEDAITLDTLKEIITRLNQYNWKSQSVLLGQLIDAKDKRKKQLEDEMVNDFNTEIDSIGEENESDAI